MHPQGESPTAKMLCRPQTPAPAQGGTLAALQSLSGPGVEGATARPAERPRHASSPPTVTKPRILLLQFSIKAEASPDAVSPRSRFMHIWHCSPHRGNDAHGGIMNADSSADRSLRCHTMHGYIQPWCSYVRGAPPYWTLWPNHGSRLPHWSCGRASSSTIEA